MKRIAHTVLGVLSLACSESSPTAAPARLMLDAPPYVARGFPGDSARIRVIVRNAETNEVVPGVTVQWQPTDATLPTSSSTSDATGVAMTTWYFGSKLGVQKLWATAPQPGGYELAAFTFEATVYANIMAFDILADTISFARGHQLRDVPATAFDVIGAPVPLYDVTWESSDSTVVRPHRKGGIDERPAQVFSGARDGVATLRATVTTGDGRKVTDSAVVVVKRAVFDTLLVYPVRHRTMIVGDPRTISISEVDSSSLPIRALPSEMVVSDPTVVEPSDSGIVALQRGAALVVLTYEGVEYVRDSVFVVPPLDLGERRSRFLNTLCPTASGLRGSDRFVLVSTFVCGGPGPRGSWSGILLDFGAWSMDVGVTAVTPDNLVFRLAGDPITVREHSIVGVVLKQYSLSVGTGDAVVIAVSPTGVLYTMTADHVIASTSDGTRWNRQFSLLRTVASVGSTRDSLLVVHAEGLTLLDAAGAVLWSLPLSEVSPRIAIGRNGVIYAWRNTKAIVAVSFDGRLLWELTLPFPAPEFFYPPHLVVDESDRLIIAVNERVVSLSSDGILRWEYFIGWLSRPVVASDGAIYVGGGLDRHVFALNAATGEVLGRTRLGLKSGAVTLDELLLLPGGALVGSDGNALYWFDVPFVPAKGWSQTNGDAGSSRALRH